MNPPAELLSEVRRLLRGSRQPGDIVFADQLVLSANAERLAFTADVTGQDPDVLVRHVGVLELATEKLHLIKNGPGDAHGPQWSPHGQRLAWLHTPGSGRTQVRISAGDPVNDQSAAVDGLVGEPEFVRWSPDGTRLLIGVADPGAERSDVIGSGTIAEAPRDATWMPLVESGRPRRGWRRAWIYDVRTGQAARLDLGGLNVWEAAWAGAHAVVAVVSRDPDESSWYDAGLIRYPLPAAGGTDPQRTGLHWLRETGREQVCHPAAAPDGRRASCIVGAMSDRGLDTGSLWVDGEVVDTLDVDVTDHLWIDDDTIVWAGQRGLSTVVGTWRADSRAATSIWWSTEDTCGRLVPEISAAAATVLACMHGYARPPELVQLAPNERVVRTLDVRAEPIGTTQPYRWAGHGDLTIEGLLTRPGTPGPHPLVVHVHGGPVWAWRNSWSMHYAYTPLLVSMGYAVLHPNARGSSGRGQTFIRGGLDDMGGADAQDLLLGVKALVAEAMADPGRIAVTGNSYGGYMAAWLPAISDRFTASVARSPVTDWISQHYTSNLPGFDQICFPGDPLHPDSPHRSRSPLYAAEHIRTPIMLMAGARDLATPADQAVLLHRALTERGRTSVLVVYPEEGHGVHGTAALADQCARLLHFLRTYLSAGAEQ